MNSNLSPDAKRLSDILSEYSDDFCFAGFIIGEPDPVVIRVHKNKKKSQAITEVMRDETKF